MNSPSRKPSKPGNIDEYIAGFPKEIKTILQQVRATIVKTVPAAEETIKYGMPAYIFKGNLVYFAAWKNHIGFYPVPSGKEWDKALSKYHTGKGSIQFPFDKPIPHSLISKLVKHWVQRNMEKAKRGVKKREKTPAGTAKRQKGLSNSV